MASAAIEKKMRSKRVRKSTVFCSSLLLKATAAIWVSRVLVVRHGAVWGHPWFPMETLATRKCTYQRMHGRLRDQLATLTARDAKQKVILLYVNANKWTYTTMG